MTKLDAIRTSLSEIEEWARLTPDWPNWSARSLADVRALLAVVEAVKAQTKGVGDCPLCGRMWYHNDGCPMKPLLEAAE